MWYNTGEDVVAQSKNYFLREINTIVSKKLAESSKRFGMNDPYPKDYAEATEWLKAGKFKMDPVLQDDEYFSMYRLVDNLEWTDDTIVRDEESYNQYVTKLNEVTKETERRIVALDLSKTSDDWDDDSITIIKTIEDLESWDWTPPTKVILPSTPTLVTEVADDLVGVAETKAA
jgi:hypothetical protein